MFVIGTLHPTEKRVSLISYSGFAGLDAQLSLPIPSSLQHMRDKFWNFIFYKFIFVFGVINVQEVREMLNWSVWFAVVGCLLLTAQLCRDRFQYVSTRHIYYLHVSMLFSFLSSHSLPILRHPRTLRSSYCFRLCCSLVLVCS